MNNLNLSSMDSLKNQAIMGNIQIPGFTYTNLDSSLKIQLGNIDIQSSSLTLGDKLTTFKSEYMSIQDLKMIIKK